MFGIFGDVDASSSNVSPQEAPGQYGSAAGSLLKQIEQSTDLPEDLKSENVSEDEKQARSLASAIADASERSLTDE